jgi:flagellar hook-associated protein 1 FlgK
LDGFAQSVASAFQTQGMPLFTDPSGNVPSSATAGFASTVQVSAAVQANPAMVRDGTAPTVSAGNETLISNVLANVFSTGATGLPEQATSLVAGYAQMASQAQATATTNTAVTTGLQTRLSSETGVSVDSEMAQIVQLQAAYTANAKVVTAVQDMWTQLLGTVTT